MRIVVVGGGSWGTAFSRLLADRGHDVVLACRDPAQARTIDATGRNPRYLTGASLAGVGAAPLAQAPFDAAELVVVALPSRAFGDVVSTLPGPAWATMRSRRSSREASPRWRASARRAARAPRPSPASPA